MPSEEPGLIVATWVRQQQTQPQPHTALTPKLGPPSPSPTEHTQRDVAKDPRFGETHALILFETPQDALRAIEGGVPIKTLNVGSMAHSTGKTMVNNVLSMDKDDVACFEKLRDLGVEFDVRKVPNDSKKDLFDLIKKANVQ